MTDWIGDTFLPLKSYGNTEKYITDIKTYIESSKSEKWNIWVPKMQWELKATNPLHSTWVEIKQT